MRIITWNVNGIRAAIGKGAAEWIRSATADVTCLQEIKANPEQLAAGQLLPFDGSHLYWNPALRPGYSGVLSICRKEPDEVQYGLGIDRFDCEGRVIRTRFPNFLLYNIYFPNGGRGLERVEYKLDFYACLLDICDRLHTSGEKIILCGDFNTAHREIDLKNPKSNATTSGFLPEERVWIDYYLDHGFVDPFRALYPDRVQYTWWTYLNKARERNIGWRLDYFLISKSLLPYVSDVITHDQVPGSDHCPVELVMQF